MRSAVLALVLIGATLLGGCSEGVLDPKGPIASAQRLILFNATGIMLAIVIPTMLATLAVAFWFRSSNSRATYLPEFRYSGRLELLVWSIPIMTVLLVGGVAWVGAYDLDPPRPIASAVKPLKVQVVSLDWKWLFIYPEQGIAVVNQMAIPAGRPISLRITSDTVMNSFYVPALAGQIYAMAGMQTRLQMLANAPGKFVGRNSQYSGGGFSDQFFEVLATSPADFDAWVAKTKQAPDKLDAAAYAKLAEKSRLVPIAYYSAVEPRLFDSIIAKYTHGHHVQAGGPPPAAPDRR